MASLQQGRRRCSSGAPRCSPSSLSSTLPTPRIRTSCPPAPIGPLYVTQSSSLSLLQTPPPRTGVRRLPVVACRMRPRRAHRPPIRDSRHVAVNSRCPRIACRWSSHFVDGAHSHAERRPGTLTPRGGVEAADGGGGAGAPNLAAPPAPHASAPASSSSPVFWRLLLPSSSSSPSPSMPPTTTASTSSLSA